MLYNQHLISFLNILFLLLITTVHSRSVPSYPATNGVITDWMSTESCDQTYGFMPCSSNKFGNLILIIGYGYLFFVASTFLSNGSEILREILGPGIAGGLLLPQLGELADATLVLVSGLTGSTTTAQRQVSVGMGLLAGSTVTLLTVVWGSCVVAGKCSGVTTSIWTCYSARIMAASIVPFIVLQLPQLSDSVPGRHIALLMAFVMSLLILISYCVYQVAQPRIQRRKLAYAKYKHLMAGILEHFRKRALGRLLDDYGQPNIVLLKKLFCSIDENKDCVISEAELKALIIGIQFEDLHLNWNDAVDLIMKDFDVSRDNAIDRQEFVNGISKWIHKAKQSIAASSESSVGMRRFIYEFDKQTRKEHTLLGPQDVRSDEVVEEVENPKWNTFKAIALLLLGAAIVAFFADPLVDVVDNFSKQTSIPPFFISFIALPLATNSGDAVSAINFARRKKMRAASLTFSEIYGKITVKILLCLTVFFALVYFRGLEWDFSAEVLSHYISFVDIFSSLPSLSILIGPYLYS
ncbi:hypothetical protein JCGZ_09837 [Jatropha curcas]|uniref:EF-hand domain-containing protein n=1 Tax=Jatropha curcas TaxID=180498 RepID=A0A067KJJ6_JATCU|nr:hypothetical protein JCGZ_09837 [Jatropha curcas]